VQDEIVRRVVHALGVRLSETERETLARPAAVDVRAFDYYLQARSFFYQYSRKSMRFAQELFERAIALDPATPGRGREPPTAAPSSTSTRAAAPRTRSRRTPPAAAPSSSNPTLAEAHASRGTALSLLGRHDEAEQAFGAAIRLDPDLFEAHYFYARDAFTRGELEKAIREYEAAMRARPEDYQSPLLVGQIFEDLGRADEARAVRRRGVRTAEEHLRCGRTTRGPLHGRERARGLGETARASSGPTGPWPSTGGCDAALQHRLHQGDGRRRGRSSRLPRAVGARRHAQPGLARARQQPRLHPAPPAFQALMQGLA